MFGCLSIDGCEVVDAAVSDKVKRTIQALEQIAIILHNGMVNRKGVGRIGYL